MIPIGDDNPTRRPAVFTYVFIALNVLAYVWQAQLGEDGGRAALFRYGMIPAVLFGHAEMDPAVGALAPWMTLFTCMFLHGGLMHLGGNMLYLWIFGNNVEDAMGRIRFVVFYLVCGVAASLTHALLAPTSEIPTIGASGAISGVLGAYVLLHPHANVKVLYTFYYRAGIADVPAWVVLGLWFLLQFLAIGHDNGVAIWAHIGGFVAGMALIPLFKERGVPLFQPPVRTRRW